MTDFQTTPPILTYQAPRRKTNLVPLVLLLWIGYVIGFAGSACVAYLVHPDPEALAFLPLAMVFMAIICLFPSLCFWLGLRLAMRAEGRVFRQHAAWGIFLTGVIISFTSNAVSSHFIPEPDDHPVAWHTLLLILLFLPLCLARSFTTFNAVIENRCPTCGYDLRAHHPGDKCPGVRHVDTTKCGGQVMKRRLFFLAALASFLLFLATWLVLFQEGSLPWMWCVVDGGGGVAMGSRFASIVLFAGDGKLGIGWTHSDLLFEGSVSLPVWAALMLTAVLPGWWVYRRIRPKILPTGLCPTCRYDLRAHQPGQKCPECGTLIPAPNPATIAGAQRSNP